jgi:hypothetical protein
MLYFYQTSMLGYVRGMCALGWYAYESDRNSRCCHGFYLSIYYLTRDKINACALCLPVIERMVLFVQR